MKPTLARKNFRVSVGWAWGGVWRGLVAVVGVGIGCVDMVVEKNEYEGGKKMVMNMRK